MVFELVRIDKDDGNILWTGALDKETGYFFRSVDELWEEKIYFYDLVMDNVVVKVTSQYSMTTIDKDRNLSEYEVMISNVQVPVNCKFTDTELKAILHNAFCGYKEGLMRLNLSNEKILYSEKCLFERVELTERTMSEYSYKIDAEVQQKLNALRT